MRVVDRTEELINHIRQGNLMKFYNSKEWRKLRLKALSRDHNECQVCRSKGKYHKAENVHHVHEVKTHPHLSLTLSNLLCVCIKCHNDIHDRLERKEQAKKYVNQERW